MKTPYIAALLTTTAMVYGAGLSPAHAASAAVAIDTDDIGGRVTGNKGPEAGVWVIAETYDLPTRYIKIVVTDDNGRYVLPDLPKANYKIWVRGYGLVDSKPVESATGKSVDLKAVTAPDAKAAAQYYPANYWYSLMAVPASAEFPGSGPTGNGIAPAIDSQQRWLQSLKGCTLCHQIGNQITREAADHTVEGWYQRLRQERPAGDPSIGHNGRGYAASMVNSMSSFGPRGVNMWVDWSKRIAAGELPKQTPPRPRGIERNVVLTLWDWGEGSYLHDQTSSDRRDATRNANGPIYGIAANIGEIAVLDPNTHKTSMIKIPGADKRYPHTLMYDGTDRVWVTDLEQVFQPDVPAGKQSSFCTSTNNKFAKYWPSPGTLKHVHVYDMKTKKVDDIETCFRTHHLNLVRGERDTMYFSGGGDIIGWIDTKTWQETRDAEKSQGWCPIVLDTNKSGGDVAITPDRAQWNEIGGQAMIRDETAEARAKQVNASAVKLDPTKDTRMIPGTYGIENNPVDNTIWFAASRYPGTLTRFDRGTNAPETCKSEVYTPPKGPDGKYLAFTPRGISFDSEGVAWLSFASGQLGSFDRRKCKTLTGEKATGDHCPEGWKVYNPPNAPRFAGLENEPSASADWFYQSWVDMSDSLGLGKDTAVVPGSNSDSLIAYVPKKDEWVTMRVPYPLGFNSRWADGRIDDPKTGWKGRGAWATYSNVPVWHEEGEAGSPSQLVKFQIRPDPLAH